MHHIGVISDTHGLLRDEAVEALRGSDLIIHAGDVGGVDILERLAEIAPVRAVRGNTDYGEFGQTLPVTDVIELARPDQASGMTDVSRSDVSPFDVSPAESSDTGPLVYVLHDLADLDLEPSAAGVVVVIYGHSHRPSIEKRRSVLYFNPGAAGHRRFTLPVTVGRLTVDDRGGVSAEIIDLGIVS